MFYLFLGPHNKKPAQSEDRQTFCLPDFQLCRLLKFQVFYTMFPVRSSLYDLPDVVFTA